MKLTALLALATMTVTASAQTATPVHPGLGRREGRPFVKGGPTFITKDATILDWPSTRMVNTACSARDDRVDLSSGAPGFGP